MKNFYIGQEVQINHDDGDLGSVFGRGRVVPALTAVSMDKPNLPVLKPGFVRVELHDGTLKDLPRESLKGIL